MYCKQRETDPAAQPPSSDNKRNSVSNQLNLEITNMRFGGTMHVHVSLLVDSHAEAGNFPKVADLSHVTKKTTSAEVVAVL